MKPRKGTFLDVCDKCNGPIYEGVPHECQCIITNDPVLHHAPLSIDMAIVKEDIATIKEDIALILERLERLEL
jgi:hypothetical protein